MSWTEGTGSPPRADANGPDRFARRPASAGPVVRRDHRLSTAAALVRDFALIMLGAFTAAGFIPLRATVVALILAVAVALGPRR